MNIAFVVISVTILIVNFGLRIYDRIKDGKFDKQDLKDTAADAQTLIDGVKEVTNGRCEIHNDKRE